MGMGFAPTWLLQVNPPPLLHKKTNQSYYHGYYLTSTVPFAACLCQTQGRRSSETLLPAQ